MSSTNKFLLPPPKSKSDEIDEIINEIEKMNFELRPQIKIVDYVKIIKPKTSE